MSEWGRCLACAGTGDRFDHETDDWIYPREDCPRCEGHGEAPIDRPIN